MKICWTAYIIKELQVKTEVRNCYTPIRTKIQNIDNTKFQWGCRGTGTLIHCYWGCKMFGSFLINRNIWSRNHDPRCLYKWHTNSCLHKSLHTNVSSSFIYNCPKLEVTQMSFDRWVDQLWYIHVTEYYSTIKRKELSSYT